MADIVKTGKIIVDKSPRAAFERAIKKGLKNPDNYMYMYSKDGKDYFKDPNASSIDKKYVSFKKGGIVKRYKGGLMGKPKRAKGGY